jgi:hypothetical protein
MFTFAFTFERVCPLTPRDHSRQPMTATLMETAAQNRARPVRFSPMRRYKRMVDKDNTLSDKRGVSRHQGQPATKIKSRVSPNFSHHFFYTTLDIL